MSKDGQILSGKEIESKHREESLGHITNMRRCWGYGLLIGMVLQTLLLDWVLIRVGQGKLTYPDAATIQVFVGGTIVQVASMAIVAVRFIYRDHSKKVGEEK